MNKTHTLQKFTIVDLSLQQAFTATKSTFNQLQHLFGALSSLAGFWTPWYDTLAWAKVLWIDGVLQKSGMDDNPSLSLISRVGTRGSFPGVY